MKIKEFAQFYWMLHRLNVGNLFGWGAHFPVEIFSSRVVSRSGCLNQPFRLRPLLLAQRFHSPVYAFWW